MTFSGVALLFVVISLPAVATTWAFRKAVSDWKTYKSKRNEPIGSNVTFATAKFDDYWPGRRWPRPREVPARQIELYVALARERASTAKRSSEVILLIAAAWIGVMATRFPEDFVTTPSERTVWESLWVDAQYLLPFGLAMVGIALRERYAGRWSWVAVQYQRRSRLMQEAQDRRDALRRRKAKR